MRSRPAAVVALSVFLLGVPAYAQPSRVPPAANAHPAYAALRSVRPAAAHQVDSLVLKRDAATFTLTGTLTLLEPVDGRITGAVFLGRGVMTYVPPIPQERAMLRILTKGEEFNETFERAVFRFTDDTAREIAAASPSSPPPAQAVSVLKDINDALRQKLRQNLHARILHDVLSPSPGALFHAYLAGRKYSPRLVYVMDPQGAGPVAPEEIQLFSWADFRGGIFAAHHYSESYRTGLRPAASAPAWVDIQHHRLETRIESGGELTGDATTTFVAQIDGLAAVPFDLHPTLRVSNVTAQTGQELAWIQEPRDEDADFWIVLPAPLKRGETFTVRTVYKGKDAVSAEGRDNYFPVARTNWYPNGTGTKDYATYEMRFSVPKRLRLVATGDLEEERVEGDRALSRWRAASPLSVAGFNLGTFHVEESRVGSVTLVALANDQPSDSTQRLLHVADALKMPIGPLRTGGANRMALTEAQLALQLFTEYFGAIALTRVHVTQQTACNYGQAWPGVLYIPTCYYWGPTVRQQIGMQQTNPAYWDSVVAHEVAHLWWGHAVGWRSYRDQWMSEGFSTLSASMFLQAAYPKEPQRFRELWRGMLASLTEKNRAGVRPIEVGPVTLGNRLSSSHTGGAAGQVLYSKGAYILHMLRMMMWDAKEGDEKFKGMLRDFVATHRDGPVSTADFQAIVEKHMLPGMNVGGDGTMGWFFRQYVHGTALPTYRLEQKISSGEGEARLSLKLTQSGVDDGFVMPVPVYAELQDGRILRLGSAVVRGNSTFEGEIPLGAMPVKRAMINYYYDVLALER